MTHTGRVSDVIQYALLDSGQASALKDRWSRHMFATPLFTLAEHQKGMITYAGEHQCVADAEFKGEPGNRSLVPVIGHSWTGIWVGLRIHQSADGMLVLDLEPAHSPRWPLRRAKPIRRGQAIEDRRITIGFGAEAISTGLQRPVAEPVEFECQFALHQHQTLILTRHDMASRDSETGDAKQCFIMLAIQPITQADGAPRSNGQQALGATD